mmetsp:Transcript_96999/g.250883  ORF Transcript_96999/g.250883 Transcript_96999/m.250883 type:complete len:224 (+) Transcript_96999:195-866(+)
MTCMPYLDDALGLAEGRREPSLEPPCVGHWPPRPSLALTGRPPVAQPPGLSPDRSPSRSRTRPRPVSTVPCSKSILPMPPWAFSNAALDCSRTIMLTRRRSARPSICVSLVVRTVSATRSLPRASELTSPWTPVRMPDTDISKRVMAWSTTSSNLRRRLSSSWRSCTDCRSSTRDCSVRSRSVLLLVLGWPDCSLLAAMLPKVCMRLPSTLSNFMLMMSLEDD